MENTSLSNGNSGFVPESGIFSVKRWAEFFETSEQTFRRWVKIYEIPFLKPGDAMFLKATDVIPRLPYINREDE